MRIAIRRVPIRLHCTSFVGGRARQTIRAQSLASWAVPAVLAQTGERAGGRPVGNSGSAGDSWDERGGWPPNGRAEPRDAAGTTGLPRCRARQEEAGGEDEGYSGDTRGAGLPERLHPVREAQGRRAAA